MSREGSESIGCTMLRSACTTVRSWRSCSRMLRLRAHGIGNCRSPVFRNRRRGLPDSRTACARWPRREEGSGQPGSRSRRRRTSNFSAAGETSFSTRMRVRDNESSIVLVQTFTEILVQTQQSGPSMSSICTPDISRAAWEASLSGRPTSSGPAARTAFIPHPAHRTPADPLSGNGGFLEPEHRDTERNRHRGS